MQRTETSKERSPNREALAETEEERRRRIKGKAHVIDAEVPPRPILDRSLNAPLRITEQTTEGRIPIQQEINQVAQLNNGTEVDKLPQIEATTFGSQDNGCEKDIEQDDEDTSVEDGEFNKMVDYYNELGMTEEMMEEDDLLDDIVVPETQAMGVEAGREKIEAIAQLGEKVPPKATAAEERLSKVVQNQKPGVEKGDNRVNTQRGYLKTNSLAGAKKVSSSPDSKGLAASKKMAARGRMSPKPKGMKNVKHHATGSLSTKQVPRSEVFPTALKGRKPVSLSGSAVSQKPPSKRI